MATVNVQALLDAQKEAGFEDVVIGNEVTPGVYTLELTANPAKNGNGIFIKGRVLTEGPFKGKLFACGTLTVGPADANPNALSIAGQHLSAIFGADGMAALAAQFGGNVPVEVFAKGITGRTVEAEIAHNEYPKGSGQLRTQFALGGKVRLLTATPLPTAAGVPGAAPAAAAPAVPVAEAAPVAPAVPVPGVPVPGVATPEAPAAPVVVPPVVPAEPSPALAEAVAPTVEELQAQLALAQAAAAAPPASPAAPVAGTPIPVADPSF
jgi:hypothetical protein